MTRFLATAAFVLAAAAFSPAMAGVGAVELPRLSFPDDSPADPSQGCTAPVTASPSRCSEQKG